VALVHLRLGESYMALGRLDEALAALQQAVRMSPYDNRDMSFALAVAFDRDEDSAQSRDALTRALERDPRMGDLLRPSRVWIPAEDSHYYLGLGYLGGNDPPRALYHLRRYLAVAGGGMWAGRARAHLEAAQAGAVAGRDVQIRGSATLDQSKTASAIGKLDGELQSCVAKTPDLLLRVSLTRVVPGADATEGSRQAGVRVLVSEQGGLKSEVLRAATSCVESAAAKIAAPRPAGVAGAYVVAEFSVIRR
jgi:tetratricopeptide (TPR) repeat protein